MLSGHFTMAWAQSEQIREATQREMRLRPAAANSGSAIQTNKNQGKLNSRNSSQNNFIATQSKSKSKVIANNDFDHDLQLLSIDAPYSGLYLTNSEYVSVSILNLTGNNEADVSVTYILDNNAAVTETIPDTLFGYSITYFDFSQTVDLSVQNQLYHLKVYISSNTDQNPLNDTLSLDIYNGMSYCTSSSDICLDYISSVQLNTINQGSSCNGYNDYTNLSTDIGYGVYSLLTIINGNSQPMSSLAVFVDWNQNADFTDDTNIPVSGGPDTFLIPLTAPNYATSGTTRMRIIISSDGYIYPCGTYNYGETEDYTINVTGSPVANDLQAVSIISPTQVSTPYYYYPGIEISNPGTSDQTNIILGYSVNNGPVVTETYTDPINGSGGMAYYTFTQGFSIDTCGNYALKVFTALPGDFNLNNDTVFATVNAGSYLQVNSAASVQSAIQALLSGSGLTISNVSFTGDTNALGVFHADCSNLGLDSGLVLSTGFATIASGPNNSGSAGYNLMLNGNPMLDSLINGTTYDAVVLEFDIVPQYDSIAFRYVFGSEEYPEYVNQYNDVFAFFVSGPNPAGGSYQNENIAIIPGTGNQAVSINTINNGLTNSGPCMNCQYYIHNMENSVQLDAFTTPLTAQFVAVPGATYHLRIAIADAVDHIYDSDVFLEAASFSSPAGNVMLSGEVEYKNNAETPIANALVKLKQAGTTIAQTQTNAYGNYQFSNIPAGTYDLVVSHSGPWGGVNSADGLLIIKYFAGITNLTELNLSVANLNNIPVVNSADALLAVRRFVGLISSFSVPDWIFETHTVTLSPGNPVIRDVKGLCAGDVNGSYTP
jgi:hypothetical protein